MPSNNSLIDQQRGYGGVDTQAEIVLSGKPLQSVVKSLTSLTMQSIFASDECTRHENNIFKNSLRIDS